MSRRICIVTGSRAEYGLLQWLMTDIKEDSQLDLQIIATGMHLSPEFGSTVNQILLDGFTVNEYVESLVSSDTNVGMVKSLGLGTISMADALRRLSPDIVVLLGDRYEILAAAQAAALMGIPIAHLYGGEVTEGAVDDWIRHSITKASWWHFVASESYRNRVIQLGEKPDRVFNVGAPGLDSFSRIKLLDKNELEAQLELPLTSPLFLVTYHPATLGDEAPTSAFNKVLAALDLFQNATVLLTKPNADAGGRELATLAEEWADKNSHRARCFTSLGQLRYLSAMKFSNIVIGNSSSGIIEAPAIKVPTVNIGPRQDGRLKASSIIDCGDSTEEIVSAISKAMSLSFCQTLSTTISLYGNIGASAAIKKVLANECLPKTLKKKFYDL
jgi:UDP-hydrolysing UDP-N-acetyl-D-glucosamine 2-epimerase